MSPFTDPKTREAIGTASLIFTAGAVTLVLMYSKSLQIPAVVSGPLTALLLLGWLVLGRWQWKRDQGLGELELRIRTDAAFLTQHLTFGALGVLLVATEFYDVPMPRAGTVFVAYFWVYFGSEWFSKRRLT